MEKKIGVPPVVIRRSSKFIVECKVIMSLSRFGSKSISTQEKEKFSDERTSGHLFSSGQRAV